MNKNSSTRIILGRNHSSISVDPNATSWSVSVSSAGSRLKKSGIPIGEFSRVEKKQIQAHRFRSRLHKGDFPVSATGRFIDTYVPGYILVLC